MTIKEAIDGAIKGGWRDDRMDDCFCLFLDPLFWQSLGKAMGWTKVKTAEYDKQGNETFAYFTPAWRVEWRHFINHLADKKTAESYFAELPPVVS